MLIANCCFFMFLATYSIPFLFSLFCLKPSRFPPWMCLLSRVSWQQRYFYCITSSTHLKLSNFHLFHHHSILLQSGADGFKQRNSVSANSQGVRLRTFDPVRPTIAGNLCAVGSQFSDAFLIKVGQILWEVLANGLTNIEQTSDQYPVVPRRPLKHQAGNLIGHITEPLLAGWAISRIWLTSIHEVPSRHFIILLFDQPCLMGCSVGQTCPKYECSWIRMLRGIICKSRIRNECIVKKLEVVPIGDKLRKKWLRWFGMCTDSQQVQQFKRLTSRCTN